VVWKKVNNTDPGDATHFGGDDRDKISDLFSAVLDVDTVDINSVWTFRDDKLKFRNPANTFSYTLQMAAIVANRDVILPLLTGNDTLVFEAHTQTLTNKSIVASQLTGIIADARMPNLTGPVTTVEGAVATTINDNSIQSNMYIDGSIDPEHLAATTATRSIQFVIDGGGSVITTGVKGFLEIPFACTINRVTLLADQSGSIVIDIFKDTYANFPPVVGDSITAAAKPTITTSNKSQDATLTGWTTSIAAGDILAFNVDSVGTHERVTLSLRVEI